MEVGIIGIFDLMAISWKVYIKDSFMFDILNLCEEIPIVFWAYSF